MAIAYIGIGANLGNPLVQAQSALEAIEQLETTSVVATSTWYRSRSLNPGQPDYLNGVTCIETSLEPATLLTALQVIENDHGRVRLERWGPRTLDLDLLLYDNIVLDTPILTLPHPQLPQRNFVVMPLLEVCPELRLPDGSRLADIAAQLNTGGLARWQQNQ